MCGAVLGFATLAPMNDSAISLSFGDSGYTTALARVFKWVRSLLCCPIQLLVVSCHDTFKQPKLTTIFAITCLM